MYCKDNGNSAGNNVRGSSNSGSKRYFAGTDPLCFPPRENCAAVQAVDQGDSKLAMYRYMLLLHA